MTIAERRDTLKAAVIGAGHFAYRVHIPTLAARPEVVPPPAFLAGTYNSVARIYDTAVAPKLQNTANEHLFALFDREFDPASRFAHVLDLGCGTGAMGAHLRSYADRLTGVDFSTGMIRIAEQKGIYDALVVDDIVRYLAQSEDQFDLIVSSDALIHLGDMAELFQHIVLRTTQGGCVLFSTEHGDCGTYAPTIHFRFQHDPDYVERTAYAGGLIVLAREQAVVRVDERGMPTRGDLFLLQKMDF